MDTANLSKQDDVFEIGSGHGILLPFLCNNAQTVTSVEIDPNLYSEIKKLESVYSNLKLICGNAFDYDASFSVLVSSLPYSQSRHTIEWLLQRKFQHSVLVVQEEFAQKLLCVDKKTAIGVLSQYAFDITKICGLKRYEFYPTPTVDSCIIFIKQRHILTIDLLRIVNKMFSQRRKTLHNILNNFGVHDMSQKRLDDLQIGEIIEIAQRII